MKIFDGWRQVGLAMRRARQQDGVTVERQARADVRARIYRGPEDAIVWVSTLPGSTWFRTYSGRVGSAECTPNAAAEGLRVLAALDLIPAELAEPGNRYAHCDQCGRLVRRNPERLDGFPVRWHHVDQDAWLTWGPHRAEVTK